MFRTRSDRPPFAAALAMAAALVSAGAAQAQDALARYVVLGADGAATARVITTAPACPDIEINGVSRTMNLRAPAATFRTAATAHTCTTAAADSAPHPGPRRPGATAMRTARRGVRRQ